jgi:queuine/archaeosine tRNA-ribosyltransferase
MIRLVQRTRAAIVEGKFARFRADFLERFQSGDTLAPAGS